MCVECFDFSSISKRALTCVHYVPGRDFLTSTVLKIAFDWINIGLLDTSDYRSNSFKIAAKK